MRILSLATELSIRYYVSPRLRYDITGSVSFSDQYMTTYTWSVWDIHGRHSREANQNVEARLQTGLTFHFF
ncbi:MAG: hypothetical protein GF418_09885 [Chitinivibrionales bacterium]|nr:hypothetical protein [Chitinivibrionales bacterium]MBD3395921.1 hypothetical protein [Chitinivibrionales bacterium]